MAEVATKKIAVVTGANKGIGFEICRQLASQGITVVLAARDEKRGLEAVEKLKDFGFGHLLAFHKLDVTDAASAAALADFVKSQFGKLDILVNNAGVTGASVDSEAMRAAMNAEPGAAINWSEIIKETYDSAVAGFETNYYGVKKVTKALLPLLQLSKSPQIVNVASELGMLKNIPNEWAKAILNDIENLTEDRINQVVSEYLKEVKEGSAKAKGWPESSGSYIVSKAAVIAYTRLVAKMYLGVKINSVCPGYTKTDLNHHSGFLTVEEGAESPVRLALLADDGPSGLFFNRKEVSSF